MNGEKLPLFMLITHESFFSFNFFLDEVIMRCNKARILELELAGHEPYSIPRSALLGTEVLDA